MNTIITEKLEDGSESSYDVFSKLVESRILFLYNHINDDVAADIVATLLYLDHEDDSKKISLYINSEAGDIGSVFMIYDIMKMINSPIETFCIGAAIGEPALLLAAGTPGMRHATKSSTIMINQLSYWYSKYGDMSSAEISLKKSKNDNERFLKALSDCTGRSIKALKKDTDRDFYMSPKDAKEYGLIDNIINNEDKNEVKKAKNSK